MNYRIGLLTFFVLAIIGFLLTFFIVMTIDPTGADALSKAAFFASISLGLMGLLVPIIFYSRVYLGNREIIYANFPIAIRQSVLLSLLFTALLLMQALRALSTWDAILLIGGVLFVELAFRSRA